MPQHEDPFQDLFEPKTNGATEVTGLLLKHLEKVDDTGKPAAERIAEKLIEMAIDGDVEAIKLIFDRVDGPIPAY